MTKISVIVTCYNLEKYLDECLRSLRDQTVLPDEVILVHDGCTHPVGGIGVTTLIREKNIGVARSRDEGFKISSGDKILFVDADDVLPENFIEKMLEIKANIVYPNCLLWSHWGESTFQNAWHEAPPRISMKKMLDRNEVVVTSMMDREVYEKVGGFNPKLQVFEDWDFFLRALSIGFTFRRANTYLKYRQRTNSRNHQDEKLKQKIYREIKSHFT